MQNKTKYLLFLYIKNVLNLCETDEFIFKFESLLVCFNSFFVIFQFSTTLSKIIEIISNYIHYIFNVFKKFLF